MTGITTGWSTRKSLMSAYLDITTIGLVFVKTLPRQGLEVVSSDLADLARSLVLFAFPTGFWWGCGGFQTLTADVQEKIDSMTTGLISLLETGNYQRVFYPADKNGTLGAGQFEIGEDVKKYIISSLQQAVKTVNDSNTPTDVVSSVEDDPTAKDQWAY